MKLTPMEIAKGNLLINHPFFGAMSVRLTAVPDPNIPTAATDGRSLIYNPGWFEALPPQDRIGLVAHEILHVASLHHTRRGSRDPKLWNVACDFAINQELIDAGFHLPEGALLDPQYKDMGAEQIYSALQEGQGGNGDGDEEGGGTGPTPQGWGDVLDAVGDDGQPVPASEMEAVEGEAKVMISQAAQQAKGLGKLPGSIKRLVDGIMKPIVDWRQVLQRFVQATQTNGHDWRRPNRRYIGQELYLPRRKGEFLEIAVAIDTSGSISEDNLRQFLGEIEGILASRPSRVHIIYCDSEINRIDVVTSDDLPLRVTPCGGGGTNFRPVFEKYPDLDGEPSCLVYITDMLGTFPKTEPDFPTLWVRTDTFIDAPFGEQVDLC